MTLKTSIGHNNGWLQINPSLYKRTQFSLLMRDSDYMYHDAPWILIYRKASQRIRTRFGLQIGYLSNSWSQQLHIHFDDFAKQPFCLICSMCSHNSLFLLTPWYCEKIMHTSFFSSSSWYPCKRSSSWSLLRSLWFSPDLIKKSDTCYSFFLY